MSLAVSLLHLLLQFFLTHVQLENLLKLDVQHLAHTWTLFLLATFIRFRLTQIQVENIRGLRFLLLFYFIQEMHLWMVAILLHATFHLRWFTFLEIIHHFVQKWRYLISSLALRGLALLLNLLNFLDQLLTLIPISKKLLL